jgi:protoheme IX farnesyltransferase
MEAWVEYLASPEIRHRCAACQKTGTLVLPLFGLGGGIYFVATIVLGALLLYSAWKVWRGEGNKVAWKMYRRSSMYLAFLFLALMVDALV